MARNSVQLQKGLSITAFLEQYGTEEQCHDALVKMKWQRGLFAPNVAAKITAGSKFEYRFNRRYKLGDMIERLAYISICTHPRTEKFTRIAERMA